MQQNVKTPLTCGKLDLHKVAWLKSLGLADDKSVVDCNPIEQTITFANGDIRQRVECWTRVMGYHRPVSAFNSGKQSEHRERKMFREMPEKEPRS